MTATMDFPGYAPRDPVRWFGARAIEKLWFVERAYERAKAQDRASDDTRVRIFVVLALFAVGFLLVAAGASRAALSPPPGNGYVAPAATSRTDLVDRTGRLLASDLAHFGLYLDHRQIWDQAETRRVLTAALPNLPPQRITRALNSRGRAYLSGGLTPQERARVDALGLPGVSFEREQRRVYPLGRTASHLIGFSDAGGMGLAGAELGLDQQIRAAGANGGGPVPLSIDLRIQAAMEDELRAVFLHQQAIGAVGMVTDVHTGEILAMVSLPDFDPNAAGRATPAERLNRAAQSVYEMGSTFKTFAVAMGLDSGTATLESRYSTSSLRIGNRSIGDYHHNGRMLTLREIFLASSNIGTGQMTLTAPEGTYPEYLRRFGFLEAAPSEMRESARPILPPRWDRGTIASASFGHALSVSPLQMSSAYAATLNGGVLRPLTLRPHRPGTPLPVGRRVLSTQTSQQILDIMRLNVIAGSGRRAEAQGLFVGGKTGSAEKPGVGGYNRTKVVSSFAGVFPAVGPIEAPRYFVLVMVDEPIGATGSHGFRTGGLVAAPVVGRVIDRIAPFLNVARAPQEIVEQRNEAARSVLPGRAGGH